MRPAKHWAAGTGCGRAGLYAHAGLRRGNVVICASTCLSFSTSPGLSGNRRQVGLTAASQQWGPQKRVPLPCRLACSGSWAQRRGCALSCPAACSRVLLHCPIIRAAAPAPNCTSPTSALHHAIRLMFPGFQHSGPCTSLHETHFCTSVAVTQGVLKGQDHHILYQLRSSTLKHAKAAHPAPLPVSAPLMRRASHTPSSCTASGMSHFSHSCALQRAMSFFPTGPSLTSRRTRFPSWRTCLAFSGEP